MAVDPRQIVAAFLTVTMFAMLGNMIKKDHFDPPVEVTKPQESKFQFEVAKVQEEKVAAVSKDAKGVWKYDRQTLKPCWTVQTSKEAVNNRGLITFSLSNGPEYHVMQIANAVVVAKYLGATLVLPDIRGAELGDKRNFADVYNLDKFVSALDGVISINPKQPTDARSPGVMKVPSRVTEDFISTNIEPAFRMKGHLRLVSTFPSVNMKVRSTEKKESDSIACLAMFGALEIQPEIRGVVDMMVQKLRTLSRRSDGQFVAVDLRADVLQRKGCRESGESGAKSCYSAEEIALFLSKVGFDRETTVYVTQPRWHDSLSPLKEMFPKTYTKEALIPADKKEKLLNERSAQLEKVIDFYVCSESDVFVPAISGMFYANVAGKRIASDKTNILVPAPISTPSASASDYVSPRPTPGSPPITRPAFGANISTPRRHLQIPNAVRATPCLTLVEAFDPSIPLSEAVTPPSSWYTDPSFLQLEYDRVFYRGWQAVGFEEHIRKPLDFFTGRLGSVEYVVCRDAGGNIRAFHNVCRHHASLIASGSGRKSCFVCPYHGWTYGLDGKLLKATRISGIKSFDVNEFGLIPLNVVLWGPFVLIDFDKNSSPQSFIDSEAAGIEWLGSCSRILSTNGIDTSLAHVCRQEYTIECNWKVFCDNYLDGGYHVPYAHGGLASGLKLDSYSTTMYEKVSIQSCQSIAADKDDSFDRLGSEAFYAFIYPNLMVNRYGPWMDTNLVLPLGPRKCLVIFDYFLEASLKDDKEFIEKSLEESERVQIEDIALCEGVQRGLESPGYCTGRYAPSVEMAMHHFHCLLHHHLTDH